jgi:glycosyltransferase involved in cell wall biosynthesis
MCQVARTSERDRRIGVKRGIRPVFSVIIPTFNRIAALQGCLESLAQLDYPATAFEVIVVDDGSAASPADVSRAFQDRLSLTLVEQEHSGAAAARNVGAARAVGRYLAFTDDDCRPARDWLRALATRFSAAPACAVGGRTLNALRENPYSEAMLLIRDVVYYHYNSDPERARFLASSNLALPADRFRAIGGFDAVRFASLSEDRDLCDRWLHHGHRMVYAPEVIVHHAHPLTMGLFCRQHFGRGRAAYHYHRARHLRGSGRLRDELTFFGSLLPAVRHALSHVPRSQVARILMLLSMWQGANAAGYLWERMSSALSSANGVIRERE